MNSFAQKLILTSRQRELRKGLLFATSHMHLTLEWEQGTHTRRVGVLIVPFTLSNTRQFYSSKGEPLRVKGLKKNYLP